MDTDERNKLKVDCLQKVDFDSFFSAVLDFFLHFFLSVFIRVNPWFQISTTKKNAASVPSQGVVLGWKRSAALMTAQPGGMSADILLAHYIAAAKVRRQSL